MTDTDVKLCMELVSNTHLVSVTAWTDNSLDIDVMFLNDAGKINNIKNWQWGQSSHFDSVIVIYQCLREIDES